MMTFDDLQEDLLPVLKKWLLKRLKYSREWNNVEITTGPRYLEIKWFDPKTQEAPEGSSIFCSRRVSPFNEETLTCEIKRQFRKLMAEQK